MKPNAEWIATCLGVDVDVVRRLQARGHLQVFDLTNVDVRRRLYVAHRAWAGRAAAPGRRRPPSQRPSA